MEELPLLEEALMLWKASSTHNKSLDAKVLEEEWKEGLRIVIRKDCYMFDEIFVLP